MDKCCRKKTLLEYIESLDINEDLKRRMIQLLKEEHEQLKDVNMCLSNCHIRIGELESTIVELSTDLTRARRLIREGK